MYNAKIIRAAEIKGYPTIVSPLVGRKVTLIAYRAVAIDDAVRFQWSFQANSAGAFVDIADATQWYYEVDPYSSANIGSYKCTVTFLDSSTSSTNVIVLRAETAIPADADENKFHNANKRYIGPWYKTHAHWKDVEKLSMLASNPALATPQAFQAELLKDPGLVYIYDLINRYGYVQLIESQNGYSFFISEKMVGTNNVPPLIGRFVNYWPAP